MPEPLTHDERDHLLSLVGADPAVGRLLPDERELIPFLLGRLPGAVGEQLRAVWYGRILGALGPSTRIGPDVSMVMPERIELDEAVSLEGRVHLDACGAGIRVGAHSEICYGSYLKNETAEGYIHIGKYSYIGAGGSIFGHRGVEIGDTVLIAPGVMIVPYQHRFERREQRVRDQGGTMARVVIEDDVYLGMSVRVLSGVTIGRGTVIGAGAVVTKDVPPYAVAVGVPARVVRYR